MKTNNWLRTIALIFVLDSMLIGCGSGQRVPKLLPVEGTVTLDGKPLDGVTVLFNPIRETQGVGAYAVTDEDGRFKLVHYSKKGKFGCEEGQYAVTFSKVTQPDGSPIPEGKTKAGVATIEQIPKVYTKLDPRNNAVVSMVKADLPDVDFKLESNAKSSIVGGAMGPGGRAGGPGRPAGRPVMR